MEKRGKERRRWADIVIEAAEGEGGGERLGPNSQMSVYPV